MSAHKTTALASRRSESSRRAILDAVLALCRQEGYARLSIEAIAARAGVGKQTIYRWWPSKGAVLLEALQGEAAAAAAYPDTGDLAADMRATINEVAGLLANPEFGPPLAALIAETQQDPRSGPCCSSATSGPSAPRSRTGCGGPSRPGSYPKPWTWTPFSR